MAANITATARIPRIVEAQDSVTRPNDTTQYAAGDPISDNATTPTAAGYFTFDFAGQPGAGYRFLDFTAHKSTNATTGADFDLLLFTTLPALAGFEDNAACAITDAEMLECKGVVRFTNGAWTNVITGAVQTVAFERGIVPTSASSTVYGILMNASTYTPAAQEVFTITAHAVQEN